MVIDGDEWLVWWWLPSGKHTKSELENGPVEILDLPIFIAWWIFPSVFLRVYQRVLMSTPRSQQVPDLLDKFSISSSWTSHHQSRQLATCKRGPDWNVPLKYSRKQMKKYPWNIIYGAYGVYIYIYMYLFIDL